MKQHYLTRLVFVFMLVLTGACFLAPAIFAEGPQPSSAACLKCHGPFDKLSSAPPFFTAPSGEKINPHRYVPHDLKEIPDCTSCHKPHPANPTPADIAALPKPTVTSCFECHHKKNFQNCQDCHKKN